MTLGEDYATTYRPHRTGRGKEGNILTTFSCGMNQKMTLLLWIGIFDFGESGLKPDRESDLAGERGSTVVGLLVG